MEPPFFHLAGSSPFSGNSCFDMWESKNFLKETASAVVIRKKIGRNSALKNVTENLL